MQVIQAIALQPGLQLATVFVIADESLRSAPSVSGQFIEAEIRSAQPELLLEAAALALTDEPIAVARQLRDRAERTIRARGGMR